MDRNKRDGKLFGNQGRSTAICREETPREAVHNRLISGEPAKERKNMTPIGFLLSTLYILIGSIILGITTIVVLEVIKAVAKQIREIRKG